MPDTHDDNEKITRISGKLNKAWQIFGGLAAPILFTYLFIQLFTNPALNM
jgi:hypothetical protein